MASQWWRIGGMLGIAFPVLFLISVFGLTGEPPGLHDSVEEIRAFYAEQGDRYLFGSYLAGAGIVLCFLPFVASLSAVLGRVEGPPAVYSRLVLVGGVVFVAASFVNAAVIGALAMGAGDAELDGGAVRALMYGGAISFSMSTLPIALVVLSAAVVIWRTGVVWRWLAVLGLGVGVAGIISPLWVIGGNEEGVLAGLGFAAFSGFLLWTLLVAVNMVRRRDLPAGAAEYGSMPAARRPLAGTS